MSGSTDGLVKELAKDKLIVRLAFVHCYRLRKARSIPIDFGSRCFICDVVERLGFSVHRDGVVRRLLDLFPFRNRFSTTVEKKRDVVLFNHSPCI